MLIRTRNHSDFSEEMQRFHDYIRALEDEREKIRVFERELPLCLQLVTQAIETCKQQLPGTTTVEFNPNSQSECSEKTSSPVLEEFIPLKRASSPSSDDEQESQKPDSDLNIYSNGEGKYSKKSDWLRSVQLWNQTSPDPEFKKVAVMEVKRNGGGAFHPFKKEGSLCTSTVPKQGRSNRSLPPASTSFTAETGGGRGNRKEVKEGERKSRRCWSPELHRRFVQALQQLGGSHAATPKQIRELMNVDGLTNDEVKSHLQKFRLHTRRPSSSNQENNNSQAPQFVVVGGIWVPPEYASTAAATNAATGDAANDSTTSHGVYHPVAALQPPFQQMQYLSHSDERGGLSEGGVRSHSPAESSSTDTATTSSPSP